MPIIRQFLYHSTLNSAEFLIGLGAKFGAVAMAIYVIGSLGIDYIPVLTSSLVGFVVGLPLAMLFIGMFSLGGAALGGLVGACLAIIFSILACFIKES
ncbi:hypothetical protein LU290_05085 [Moraxella nasibovis]|uniref:hypothetical protein n=1 Tax=Moraxella nasibovis TaxID=2904120 RepID=UPI00240EE136|nr:hypothetical protein [Moraxella nasibovis]WFF39595.1 hypothetical protein LU290_05085 [Moraxella nasibovis]